MGCTLMGRKVLANPLDGEKGERSILSLFLDQVVNLVKNSLEIHVL